MSDKRFEWARRWGLGGALAALLAAALVVGCGGGGAGTAGTKAAAYTSGPVSGFGSVIVNGVRFDDSSAEVEDEDGNAGSSASLKLGTMVEIESDKVDDSTGRARALRIRFGSELVGPVASVDTSANTFVMLDQVVEVRPETVFDDSLSGDVAGLAGLVVEVHALFDASSGHYIATRIEDEDDALFFKLRGVVSALDTTAKTFQIGAAVISYAGIDAAELPAGFADGLKVRVRLQTGQVTGPWVAASIRSGVRKVEDHDDARLRGTITAFTSSAAFEVNGIPVDASNASFDGGTAGLVLGARVEVRGSAKDGTIIASRVKVLDDDDDAVRGIELSGSISGLDSTAKSFTLRGVTVNYTELTVFERGTAADLVDGAQVEVKGVLSADRSSLTALLIEFED